MRKRCWIRVAAFLAGVALLATVPDVASQPPGKKGGEKKFDKMGGPPMGGPGGQVRKLVKQFDKDSDGRLNRKERDAAREFLKQERAKGGGPGGPGGPGGIIRIGPGGPGGGMMIFGPQEAGQVLPGPVRDRLQLTDKQKKYVDALQKDVEAKLGKILDDKQKKSLADIRNTQFGPGGFGMGNREPPKPGPKMKVEDAKTFPKAALYDPTVLRTFFLEFEHGDWEAELADFYRTDVEIPATLTVDGKKYPNVGVHFRGMSSYFRYGAGWKRSLNVSLDFVDKKQRLYGHKTLNLLNGADDPSLLHAVLYSQLGREHIPVPKANLSKVVINGESWGIYPSVQQFDKEFVQENYKTDKGTRWKVPGPGAGGLEYVGDNVEDYKRRFSIKSKDTEKAWKALVNLCKVLNTTPADKLEAALKPILDIESTLWFLALDVALINNDGYWTRASDYNLYLDAKGKFRLIPHDMNETFVPAMSFGFGGGGPGGPGGGPGGPGGRGPGGPPMMMGPQGGGFDLDPLVGLNDAGKPLRSKLLAVPALRERYLRNVRAIAQDQLDWKKLGPVVAEYRKLIEKEVEADTRKVNTFPAFQSAVADTVPEGRGGSSLRAFAEQRRAFLLKHPEIVKLDKAGSE